MTWPLREESDKMSGDFYKISKQPTLVCGGTRLVPRNHHPPCACSNYDCSAGHALSECGTSDTRVGQLKTERLIASK